MEKKQQNRGGGIVFYIILAAIIGIIIFSVRSFNKKGDDYSYSQFVQDLNDGIVSCVTRTNRHRPVRLQLISVSRVRSLYQLM